MTHRKFEADIAKIDAPNSIRLGEALQFQSGIDSFRAGRRGIANRQARRERGKPKVGTHQIAAENAVSGNWYAARDNDAGAGDTKQQVLNSHLVFSV
jgi:hypothetical protein